MSSFGFARPRVPQVGAASWPPLALCLTALIGCGSPEQQRSDLLDQVVRGCERGFEEQRRLRPNEVPAALNSRELCRCSIERLAANVPTEQLKNWKGPVSAADAAVVQECGLKQGVGPGNQAP